MGDMRELKVLDISNNDISTIPTSLGFISSLNRIALDGNPLKGFKRSLLDPSTPITELKSYLRMRSGRDEEKEGPFSNQFEIAISENDKWRDIMRRSIEDHVIDLSNQNLSTSLPDELVLEEVVMCVNVINLSNNDFTSPPSNLQAFNNSPVTELNMSHNSLSQVFVDESLIGIPLSILNLSHNSIKGDDLRIELPPDLPLTSHLVVSLLSFLS